MRSLNSLMKAPRRPWVGVALVEGVLGLLVSMGSTASLAVSHDTIGEHLVLGRCWVATQVVILKSRKPQLEEPAGLGWRC